MLATTNLPEPYPDDGAITWIEAVQEQREDGTEYPFAILNEDDTLVGVTGLRDVTDDRAEVGFWIGKSYWNQGYAMAGTRQLLTFAFDELGLSEVFARPLKRNAPSRRVLEKLGFTAVGEETHEHPKWTADDPVIRYELTRQDGRSDAE